MALSTKLELRQGQQLVMTPQLQQAIRLLAAVEHRAHAIRREPSSSAIRCSKRDDGAEAPVRTEIETSEFAKPEETAPASETDCARPRQAGSRSRRRPSIPTTTTSIPTARRQITPTGRTPPAGLRCASARSGSGDDVNIEAFVANDVSLREHLAAQVPLVLKEPVERLIGQYLVDMVDEAGYLPGPISARSPRSSAHRSRSGREGAREPADARPARRVRPLARRVPGAAAQGAEPLRPDHQPLPREPASAGRAQPAGAAQGGRHARWTSCSRSSPRSRSSTPSRASSSARCKCSPWCRTCSCARRPTAAGSSSSTPTRCRACWSTAPISRPCRRRPARRPTATISSNACRPPTGW